jgi:hypothetical protein
VGDTHVSASVNACQHTFAKTYQSGQFTPRYGASIQATDTQTVFGFKNHLRTGDDFEARSMKHKTRCFVALVTACIGTRVALAGDTLATTSNGRTVIPHDNGTWNASRDGQREISGIVILRPGAMTDWPGDACEIDFVIESNANIFFKDYMPSMVLFDDHGYEVGTASPGTQTNNLRPGSTVVFPASGFIHNTHCNQIKRAVVSGFNSDCDDGGAKFQQCFSLLEVQSDSRLIIIKK